MSLNMVHLVGRAGMNADIKYFDSGKSIGEVTLAVRRMSRDDQPDWFNLKFFGKTAEIANNYVKKGALIGVQGSLKIETWNDATTGSLRSKPVIYVSRLDLLGSKQDTEAAAASYSESGYN
ncbi:single-stranded DNA-binding protein [Oscillatoria sp. FACHB-1406]|uniref:single-stranded DNA-binding protein n=1 Tax=Oscillatoria sp. FACHB-1406 TaxID=2692846 RepID=UPI001683743B|nr:single-stranded DNA-binding protein [Oscillatoria sp. FACHB-1406]MBD2576205.1 single-stranded DNA-binding protein [Oscillatoria sp. FACHB-1406]